MAGGRHKGAQTAISPSHSPSRSLETARTLGRACALDFCPGAKVSGSQTDLLTPWYDGWAEVFPFRYLPVLLGGKGTSHVGWDTGDLPYQGENYGHRTPPGPCVPHGGTPEAPNRRLRVVAPRPQYPSPHQGGTLSEHGSGIVVVVSSSCRVVVSQRLWRLYQIAPAKGPPVQA